MCAIPRANLESKRGNMIAPRNQRIVEQEEPIKQAMQEPLARLKANLLEICRIDDELGVVAIATALRENVPAVLRYLAVK
jgi:gamma-glutamyl phosphate reductase